MPNKQDEMAIELTEVLITYGLPAEDQIIRALEQAYRLGKIAGMQTADEILFGKKQPEVINNKTK